MASQERELAPIYLTGIESEVPPWRWSKNPVKYKDHAFSKLPDSRFFQAFPRHSDTWPENSLNAPERSGPAGHGERKKYRRTTKKGAEAPFLLVTGCYAGKAGGLTPAMSSSTRTTWQL